MSERNKEHDIHEEIITHMRGHDGGHAKDETSTYVLAIAILLGAMFVSAAFYMAVGNLSNDIKDLKTAVANIKVTTTSGGSTGGTGGTGGTGNNTNSTPQTIQAAQISLPDYSTAYVKGNPNGKIVFVEYSDFQCPFCGRASTTLEPLKTAYASDTKFIFREFPLPASMHPNAEKAAEAAECAGKQGKFYEMHDKLFANQTALAVTDLKNYASQIGLNTATFNTCLDNGETASKIQAEVQEGAGIGVGGTPSFFIYSNSDRSAATETKLNAIVADFTSRKPYAIDASLIEVQGAGAGIQFAGALAYNDYKSIMDALGG